MRGEAGQALLADSVGYTWEWLFRVCSLGPVSMSHYCLIKDGTWAQNSKTCTGLKLVCGSW
jgi:hypothetical protein